MYNEKTTYRQMPENELLYYNMTNDYMFRAVLQKNQTVLRGLVGALLHLDPETLEVEITNPIILGESFSNKDFILDINVIVNGKTRLNLEMQIVNYHNWKERSLSYLCRSFDRVYKGDDYISAIPVIQISFLDFDLFPENPEFYATYLMKNVKNNMIYTDKMQLSVIELNRTALATEEDRRYELDKWVTFFNAKTWKELKDMAATNQYIEAAANTIFEINSDENIRELCRRRAEFEAYERYNAAEHARKDSLLLQKDQQLAEKDLEIARLKALLAQANAAETD
ncbi:MAG: Rpn family recombination-promoting nuclease/putative transposase [Lachnospiraceae bacterium]|nr:Rpn family recombination-promoting nuclease/putative transposase [Lachnospiraceae bacterium]